MNKKFHIYFISIIRNTIHSRLMYHTWLLMWHYLSDIFVFILIWIVQTPTTTVFKTRYRVWKFPLFIIPFLYFLFLPCLPQFASRERRGADESWRVSPPAIYEWKSTHVSCARCCRLVVVTCDARHDYSRVINMSIVPEREIDRYREEGCIVELHLWRATPHVRLRIPGSRSLHQRGKLVQGSCQSCFFVFQVSK